VKCDNVFKKTTSYNLALVSEGHLTGQRTLILCRSVIAFRPVFVGWALREDARITTLRVQHARTSELHDKALATAEK